MPTGSYSITLAAAGVTLQSSVNREADGTIGVSAALPAAKAGTLTTRTDNDTGEATLSGGHGITTGMIVDVYWSGGMRYGMTVGTVATNVVPIDGGSGDNLPSTSTALTMMEQVQINLSIDGDALKIIGFKLEYSSQTETSVGHVDCQDSGSSSIAAIDLQPNSVLVYDIEGGASNVFTGNPITKIEASHQSSASAATLKVAGIVDATT